MRRRMCRLCECCRVVVSSLPELLSHSPPRWQGSYLMFGVGLAQSLFTSGRRGGLILKILRGFCELSLVPKKIATYNCVFRYPDLSI